MNHTAGMYPTESESLAEFDRIAEASGAFRIEREVVGWYMNHRPGRDAKQPRIDRLLIPTEAAIEKGWQYVIGVEGKRSGSKLGPLVCQALDYSHAVFEVDGNYIHPRGVFIWPVRKTHGVEGEQVIGAIESVMAQNCIGTCWSYDGSSIEFQAMPVNPLRIGIGGLIEVTRADIFGALGRKRGSR